MAEKRNSNFNKPNTEFYSQEKSLDTNDLINSREPGCLLTSLFLIFWPATNQPQSGLWDAEVWPGILNRYSNISESFFMQVKSSLTKDDVVYVCLYILNAPGIKEEVNRYRV